VDIRFYQLRLGIIKDGKPKLDSEIYKGMIDTGSKISFINTSLVSKLKLESTGEIKFYDFETEKTTKIPSYDIAFRIDGLERIWYEVEVGQRDLREYYDLIIGNHFLTSCNLNIYINGSDRRFTLEI